MKEISKHVNLLYILHDNHILMRKFRHQDYEVIDVFSFKDGSNPKEEINAKLNSLFGKSFPYNYYGNIHSIIKKDNETVYLNIKTYKVLVDEKPSVLDSYTDDVVMHGGETVWIHKNEIENETRLREGDKKILKRIFNNRNIDIKIAEDQGERWIDAKIITYEDK